MQNVNSISVDLLQKIDKAKYQDNVMHSISKIQIGGELTTPIFVSSMISEGLKRLLVIAKEAVTNL